MALRHMIRLILLVVFVWRVAVYWDLLLRDWGGWAKLSKKRAEAEETTTATEKRVQEAKAF
jgi:hypothetical protein